VPDVQRHRAQLVACFAIVYLVWGSTYVVTRVGVLALPPFLFGGVRFLAAGVLLLAAAAILGRRRRIDASLLRQAAVTGFSLVLMSNGGNAWGMQWVESNQAALLNASAAFWIVIFGLFGARAHRPSRRVALGLVIGFLGTALILWRNGAAETPSYRLAELAILVGCMGWAAGTIYLRNSDQQGDVIGFSGLQMLCGGVMMTVIGIAIGEASRWHASTAGFAALAYMTIASSCVAYTAYAWLARHVSPASIGTYGYVNPAVATVLGWIILGERLTRIQLLGMVVMLLGVALVTWPSRPPA